jgi:DNA-binding Lrp family transcriptional regulator
MKLKPLDYQIVSALMKNAKISDRQLAKEIGVSQPTVTRRRARLEKKALDGYTTVPKWTELGLQILAITLVKSHPSLGARDSYEAAHQKAKEWIGKQPNVIMSSGIRGMSRNGVMISVHKSYADFDKFMSEHKRELGDMCSEIETALVNLGGADIIKPLHLKYLAAAL